MKFFLPVVLACLAVACVPPKPGTAAHQRLLENQAKENFYALKDKERKSAPPSTVARTEEPAKVRLKPFTATTFEFTNPFASSRTDSPAKPLAQTKPAAPPKPVVPIKPFIQARPAATPKPIAAVKSPAPAKPVAAAKPLPPAKPIAPQKRTASVEPPPKTKPSKPLASLNLFAAREKARPTGETVFYHDVPHNPEPASARYRAYKAHYARSLAKHPEDLTPEEREWVRRHYRD